MIIARAPLRISIGGGGSDLPSYYERFGGSFISAAIDKYVYVGINSTFTDEYFIRYSSQERLTDAEPDPPSDHTRGGQAAPSRAARNREPCRHTGRHRPGVFRDVHGQPVARNLRP